ncbi:uncharacterized protein BO95DRAFT_444439 [Aspergillus brunneoviolaceus CBS 621.78]|uniref:Uncharacterized protein n=1 Tax=Aspergillus brunneoviolaceus CBS 621.78 TaxID=1450534 RepID=A0ACD1G4K4_9EURO|nr:hypothetical protein BO95DRAFT_444439 [Aspergillus brunneoviolaceus CBS 621.78]RAH44107.1 hypothetical protein BO95DRAFT_444439 [Aspergillus brunneoviolaceus CBS 621.78]
MLPQMIVLYFPVNSIAKTKTSSVPPLIFSDISTWDSKHFPSHQWQPPSETIELLGYQ